MNLNEFVVLPNSKAKSVKLNARNLHQLQMHTVTLAQEQRSMEENLQQLKETMSKQKAERSNSAGFRWKSGQRGSMKNVGSTKKTLDDRVQKLLAGREKIRVLKAETKKAPPLQQTPPTTAAGRKSRLRGTQCSQCEVNSAGLMCVDCTDYYCIGCFVAFHQKGALKLHKMVPIQRTLQTHVTAPDVLSCLQTQRSSDLGDGAAPTTPDHMTAAGREEWSGEQEVEALAKPASVHVDLSQLLAVCQREEDKVGAREAEPEAPRQSRHAPSLLTGDFDEEESARSFQEAVAQWRGGRGGAGGGDQDDTPARPVSATATQTDLATVGGAKRAGGGRVPVRVEFRESGLTYMDRLLLKKHRRTSMEGLPSPPLGERVGEKNNSVPAGEDASDETGGEEPESGLAAAQLEEESQRCGAPLFAIPASGGSDEPESASSESFLTIEVLNENMEDYGVGYVADQRMNGIRKFPAVPRAAGRIRARPSAQPAGDPGEAAPPAAASRKLRPSKREGRPQQPSSQKMEPSADSTRASGKTPPPQERPRWPSLSPPSLTCPLSEVARRPSPAPLFLPPDVSPPASSSLPTDLHLSPPPPLSAASSFGSASSAAQWDDPSSPQSSQSISLSLSGCFPSLELLQSPLNSPASSWGQSQPSQPAGAQQLAPPPPLPPRSSNQNLPAAAAASLESGESSLLLKALSTVYLFSEPPPDNPHRPHSAQEGSPECFPVITHNALAEEMGEDEEDDLSTGSGADLSADSLAAAQYDRDSLEEEGGEEEEEEEVMMDGRDETLQMSEEDGEMEEEERELADTLLQVGRYVFPKANGCSPPPGVHVGLGTTSPAPSYLQPTEGFWLRSSSSSSSFSEERLATPTAASGRGRRSANQERTCKSSRPDGQLAPDRRRPLVSGSAPSLLGTCSVERSSCCRGPEVGQHTVLRPGQQLGPPGREAESSLRKRRLLTAPPPLP